MDWQAYLAGALPPEEMARHEEALRNDPNAREELEGLRQFIAKCREAGHAEPCPLMKLEGHLSRVAAGPKRMAPRARFLRFGMAGLAAAAVAFVAFFLTAKDPIQIHASETLASRAIHAPAEAREWVRETNGLSLPPVELAGKGELKNVSCGVDWACYDFTVDGQPYSLIFSRDKQCFSGAKKVEKDGRTYFVGHGIGWQCSTYSYYLKGGSSDDQRWRVANSVVKDIFGPR